MAIYVYRFDSDEDTGERFEFFQNMTDPPLTQHPETGQPIVRVLSSFHVAGKYSSSATKKSLSDKNLERLGFTKYVKGDKGYEKTAGKGPNLIKQEGQSE